MPSESDRLRPRNETGPGGNDLPPRGEEARDQRRETSLPLVWLILGLVLVGAFALWIASAPAFNRHMNAPSASTAARLAPDPGKPMAH